MTLKNAPYKNLRRRAHSVAPIFGAERAYGVAFSFSFFKEAKYLRIARVTAKAKSERIKHMSDKPYQEYYFDFMRLIKFTGALRAPLFISVALSKICFFIGAVIMT